jgi:hypothetical protein
MLFNYLVPALYFTVRAQTQAFRLEIFNTEYLFLIGNGVHKCARSFHPTSEFHILIYNQVNMGNISTGGTLLYGRIKTGSLISEPGVRYALTRLVPPYVSFD